VLGRHVGDEGSEAYRGDRYLPFGRWVSLW